MLPLADTASWIAVGFAVGAAVLALAASLVLFVLVFRRGGQVGPATAPAVPDADRAAAPGHALEDARADIDRSRRLSEIATTIDLDAVLEKTLAAAASTGGVDAAMAVVRHSEDAPLVATLGMTAAEAARQPVSSSPSGGARSVRISYRYDGGDEPEPEHEPGVRLIRGGVAVPLHEEHIGTIGTLAVFWRGDDRVPEDGEITELEALARTSAPAIRNAQKFLEARELTDRDTLTGVHNRRYFHETLAQECARAQRYERGLALLVFDIEVVQEANDGRSQPGDSVLGAVGERLRGAVRQADVACRLGGDRFAVILPEAGARDAEHLYNRIQVAVGSGLLGQAERIHLAAGIAELRPEDDVVALFQRADNAVELEQAGGNDRVQRARGLPSGFPD
jgi:diguanylate cyclase (GGDEF)-like protein